MPRTALAQRAVPRVLPRPRRLRRWAGPVGGAVVLVVLVARLGAGPFRAAVADLDLATLAVTTALGAVSTTACAWRWVVLARRFGLHLGLRAATADYYRAVLLNAVLPGGVLGDVHRAVRTGQDGGSVRRASASVVLERLAGQVVLLAVGAVAVLLPGAVPWPPGVHRAAVVAVAVLGAAGLVAVVVRAVQRSRTAGRGALRADARDAAAVLLSSLVAVAAFAATFVVAARAAGVTAPLVRLLPLVLVALVAAAVPANVGGWGPREGAAAWAFGVAGLGAAQGLEASVVYGVCALVASLPGAVVLLVRRSPAAPDAPVDEPVAVPAGADR